MTEAHAAMWDHATRDFEAEALMRKSAQVRVAAAPLVPYLTSAVSHGDLDSRLALSRDGLEACIAAVAGGDAGLAASLRESLHASIIEDWKTAHEARQESSRQAAQDEAAKRVAAGLAKAADKVCPTCKGSGVKPWRPGSVDARCATCKGTGKVADKTSAKVAVHLTNVGIEGELGVGTDPSGNRVNFLLTDKDKADLKAVLYSDLAVNFSGVDVDQADIVTVPKESSKGVVRPFVQKQADEGLVPPGTFTVTCPRCRAEYPNGGWGCPQCNYPDEPLPEHRDETGRKPGPATDDPQHRQPQPSWLHMLIPGGAMASKTAGATQEVYKGTSPDESNNEGEPDATLLQNLVGKYVTLVLFNEHGVAADYETGRITEVHPLGAGGSQIEWQVTGREDSYPMNADAIYKIVRLEEPTDANQQSLFAASKNAANDGTTWAIVAPGSNKPLWDKTFDSEAEARTHLDKIKDRTDDMVPKSISTYEVKNVTLNGPDWVGVGKEGVALDEKSNSALMRHPKCTVTKDHWPHSLHVGGGKWESCGGAAKKKAMGDTLCHTCEGEGKIDGSFGASTITCPDCKGSGKKKASKTAATQGELLGFGPGPYTALGLNDVGAYTSDGWISVAEALSWEEGTYSPDGTGTYARGPEGHSVFVSLDQHGRYAMRKGAPFAGYEDFDACVKANSDKDDPEAYCGKIKHQVEDGKEGSLVFSTSLDDITAEAIIEAEAILSGRTAAEEECGATDDLGGHCVYRKGHDTSVFPHRYQGGDEDERYRRARSAFEMEQGRKAPNRASDVLGSISCKRCTAGKYIDGTDCDFCDGNGSLTPMLAMLKNADGWDQGITAEAFRKQADEPANDFDPNTWHDQNFGRGKTENVNGIDVHYFDSSAKAYNESQVSNDIKDGDILAVPSEGLYGILNEAWPVAIVGGPGEFHTANLPLMLEHHPQYQKAIDTARQMAAKTASKTAVTDRQVLDAIQAQDPDGRSSTPPTDADYRRFDQWIVDTYGEQAKTDYYGVWPHPDGAFQYDPNGAYASKQAVDESAKGTDRYQHTPHPSRPGWTNDEWEDGKAPREMLDEGRAGAPSSNPTSDHLETTKRVEEDAKMREADDAAIQNTGSRFIRTADDNPFGGESNANPFAQQHPVTHEPQTGNAGTRVSPPDTSLPVESRPLTTRPRQRPTTTNDVDTTPVPMQMDTGQATNDSITTAERMVNSPPPLSKAQVAKVDQIEASVLATNPGMDKQAARRIAVKTVRRFPVAR